MAFSSILGADKAPLHPSGRSSDLLGPSDNSDSGSDAVGTTEAYGDSDGVGTGERGAVDGPDIVEGADILPDRVVRLNPRGELVDDDSEGAAEAELEGEDGPGSGRGFPAEDADAREFTDIDDAITDADL